jgi:folate-binding protein YgfZ
MRAKAKLSDASDDYALFGLAGDAINLAAISTGSAWSKVDLGPANLIFLYPADGIQRALYLTATTEAPPQGEALSTQDWLWGEVRSGIATVTLPIVEAFVPQMLNYESVGGVNFKKGCYPGQEVVARSQFRGTLKRRAYLVHSELPLKAGDEIFLATDATQPYGTVAQAAAVPTDSGLSGFDAIVVLQVAAVEAGELHLGSATGPALIVAPAPYPLLADI